MGHGRADAVLQSDTDQAEGITVQTRSAWSWGLVVTRVRLLSTSQGVTARCSGFAPPPPQPALPERNEGPLFPFKKVRSPAQGLPQSPKR